MNFFYFEVSKPSYKRFFRIFSKKKLVEFSKKITRRYANRIQQIQAQLQQMGMKNGGQHMNDQKALTEQILLTPPEGTY